MKHPNAIKPLTAVERHVDDMARQPADCRSPLLITQDSEAAGIVRNVFSDDRQAETSALFKLIAQGQQELTEGRFRDAQKVLDDLDRLDDA